MEPRGRHGVTVLLGTILLLLGPAAAWAHGALRRSTPASSAHLTEVPREIRLTFNEPVELAMARVVLSGPAGEVSLGSLSLAPESASVLVAPIAGRLSAGSYRVEWRIAGRDGHPVRGDFSFMIAPGAAGLAAAPGPTAPGQDPPPASHHDQAVMPDGAGFSAESPLYVAIRWLTYLSLAVVIGAVAFRFAVALPLQRRHDPAVASVLAPALVRAARVGGFAAISLGVAALVRLLAQSYALHGSAALRPDLVGSLLVRTMWGWGWILQVMGTGIAFAGLRRAESPGPGAERDPSRGADAGKSNGAWGWPLAASGVLLIALFPALSGHAAATARWSLLAVAADMVHVLAAGGWIGGLLVLLIAGLPAARGLESGERASAVAQLVNTFSPGALAFAGALTLTGLFAAVLHLGSVPALWETTYGRTLMVKLGLLTIVFGTGAYNWRTVRPALGEELGAERLSRSATIEIAVGALVLAVTAVLVATGTPRM